MPIGLNHETESVNAHSESIIETGAIYSSARSSAPSGYLLCDGSEVSRTAYSRLFTAIGTSFGIGNGSTTFNLPDGRGGVLRGAGTSSGYTQNVTVTLGTKQNDGFQSHRHTYGAVYWGSTFNDAGPYAPLCDITVFNSSSPVDDGNGTPRTTSETRMKNIGVNFYIKF